MTSMTNSEPAGHRTSMEDLQGRMHFVVGEEEESYSIPGRLLCDISGLYRRTKSELISASCVFLEEQDPHAFDIFTHWLYTSKLPVVAKREAKDDEREYLELAKAWVLGEKLECKKFQNDVMDALVARRNEDYDELNIHPLSKTVGYIYSHTTERSKLRNFVVDMYLQKGYDNRVELWEDQSRIPLPLLIEIAEILFDRRKSTTNLDQKKVSVSSLATGVSAQ
ncbi:hypothetical protein BJX62DRAFT_233719 [Aspergillus germanicus]